MVSPSRAFFVNAASNAVEDGTADLQTASNFALSTFTQQYSLAMDGLDTGAIDGIQQLLSRAGAMQFDGKGNLKLSEVANASVLGANNTFLSGTYTVGSNGRIVGTMSTSGGGLGLVMYAVSPSQAYVLQTDQSLVSSGTILLQQ